tara:strand:- start:2515 stop:3438 length:924 start_codon:yes stop_codon:yes gene_type:complete
MRRILVTGCAGFIGSHFVEEALCRGDLVIGVDCLTYAGKLENMSSFQDDISFYQVDICDTSRILDIIKKHNPDWIVNFAAETHVDNSIQSCDEFIRTNISGVRSLLDACRKISCNFIQISTDEVYGTISEGSFLETDVLNPRNPYSATKAAAEHLVNAYSQTYGVPFKIIRMSNNFGPRQDREKFLPTAIRSLTNGRKIPVYGDGSNVRDWLYVKDACKLIYCVLLHGKDQETYNVTYNNEMSNLELVRNVIDLMGLNFDKNIEFVEDRPGHDFRYSIDNSRLRGLGISQPIDFKLALKETIESWSE